MLDLDVLIQTALAAVALRAIFQWALIVARDLCSRPTMTLLLLVVDLEGHIEHFLVLALIRL